jgi:transcriptional antiterminator RfaH
MDDWYAVQAKRHHEARVVRRLEEKAVPAFLPFIEVIRRYRTRRRVRLEPLFPGYLFVRLRPVLQDPAQWQAVQWAPGVRAILGCDGAPMPVPDQVIEAIKARVEGLGFVRPPLPFARDTRVVIRRGPLAGLEAVFERQLSGSGRVQLLMQFLGQQRRVQVDALDLESA